MDMERIDRMNALRRSMRTESGLFHIDAALVRIANLEDELAEEKEKPAALTAELEKVKAELEEAHKKTAGAQAERLAAEMRCVNLTSQLETSRGMFDSAIKNLETARADVDSLKAELDEARETISDLKCVTPNKDATIAELQDEVAELRRALKESGGDPESCQQVVGFAAAAQARELTGQDENLSELKAALADMKAQRDRALSDLSDVQHLGAQKNGQIDSLRWVVRELASRLDNKGKEDR